MRAWWNINVDRGQRYCRDREVLIVGASALYRLDDAQNSRRTAVFQRGRLLVTPLNNTFMTAGQRVSTSRRLWPNVRILVKRLASSIIPTNEKNADAPAQRRAWPGRQVLGPLLHTRSLGSRNHPCSREEFECHRLTRTPATGARRQGSAAAAQHNLTPRLPILPSRSESKAYSVDCRTRKDLTGRTVSRYATSVVPSRNSKTLSQPRHRNTPFCPPHEQSSTR